MTTRRRLTKWFTTLRAEQAIAINGQLTFPLLADLSASQTEGATITRILLSMWARNDTVGGAKRLDWGIVLLDGEAVSAGAFPDTDDEDERVDWMARGRMHAATAVLFENTSHTERDLGASRIIRDEFKSLRLIMDTDGVAAGGLFVTFFTRVLVRMP